MKGQRFRQPIRRLPSLPVLVVILALAIATSGAPLAAQQASPGVQPSSARIGDDFRSSPVMFIENAGQWPEAARFQVWGGTAGTMWLAEDAIWLTIAEQTSPSTLSMREERDVRSTPPSLPGKGIERIGRVAHLHVTFPGANPRPRLEPFDRLDTKISYFLGNDPEKWRSDVPVWGGVRYSDLYPGIDLEVTGKNGQLVQCLVVRPGADVNAVRLAVEGADIIAMDDYAHLHFGGIDDFVLPLLQITGTTKAFLPRPFLVGNQLMFPFASATSRSEPQSPASDPVGLAFSTFLGGSSLDWGIGTVVDASGASYVTGMTWSSSFPTASGSYNRYYDGYGDAFVAKLTNTGNALTYGTFLGGGGGDYGYAVTVDGNGAVYVSGGTNSYNFPTTSGSYDRSYNGSGDTFVVKLNTTGSSLVYSTFLGGTSDDSWGPFLDVDSYGAAYITGRTRSQDFPTTSEAFDRTYNGGSDAFVAKLNATGSQLAFSTFLGGSGVEWGFDIAVSRNGAAYVTGYTDSSDFPTTAGALDRLYGGGTDAFIARLSDTGASLVYGTFLGGSSLESGYSISVDESGTAYVTGVTWSSNFPVTSGVLDASYNGYGDAFVAKLDGAGSSLIYATFLGGTGRDYSVSIDIDHAGYAYIAGITQSQDMPTTFRAFDSTYNGGRDIFVAKLDSSGSTLQYSSFLGGSSDDGEWDWSEASYYALGMAADDSSAIHVTGITFSPDFPISAGAFDISYNGSGDTFVVKLALGGAPTYTITGRVTDASGTGIGGVTIWAGATRSTTTDANGNYTFAGLSAGTYNISPSRYLYAFSPASRTVTVPPDATGQDFVQTPIVDLSVNRIEVAQVFVEQNDPISGTPIPLIAQKDTLVRVYVGVSGAASVGGVSARLHIRQPNGTETIDSRPVNVWPVQAKQTPDPFSLQDTINFRPATKLLQGNVTFWADVDPENRIPETNESNNTGGQVSKTFQAGKPVRIAITRIGYRNSPFGAYSYADWNTIVRADSMLRQIYPVATNDVSYVYQPGNPEPVQCVLADDDACWTALRNALKTFWYRIDDEEQWATGTAPHALVGWVPGIVREPGGKCGEALQGNPHQTIVTDYCDNYIGAPLALAQVPVERVLAHEVGHLLNYNGELKHAKNEANAVDPQCRKVAPDPDPQYPAPASYPIGSIFAHGLNLQEPEVLSPRSELPGGSTAMYDLMSYCSPAWISPYNYLKLNTGFVDPPLVQAIGLEATTTVRKLLVSGLVYAPAFQVELDPFYVLDSALPASASSGSAYCLELRNASGAILDNRCFDLSFVDPESYEPVTVDGFALTIPYPAGTTQIVLTHLGTPIAIRAVSLHAPTVRLLSPNGGETWAGTGTHTVTWTASDLDGDPLHFALTYSTDGGTSWIPAGSDLTGTQHALDVSMLPGGTSVLLRISATDGVNTTDDVSDAPFTVGRKAPMEFILSPEDGAHFFPGQAIWLEGRAFDLEDGTLNDAALRWSSDRDGVLGTGKLLITTLSPGEHVVTLTATDSDGVRATATIRLSAGARQFLPLIWRSQ